MNSQPGIHAPLQPICAGIVENGGEGWQKADDRHTLLKPGLDAIAKTRAQIIAKIIAGHLLLMYIAHPHSFQKNYRFDAFSPSSHFGFVSFKGVSYHLA